MSLCFWTYRWEGGGEVGGRLACVVMLCCLGLFPPPSPPAEADLWPLRRVGDQMRVRLTLHMWSTQPGGSEVTACGCVLLLALVPSPPYTVVVFVLPESEPGVAFFFFFCECPAGRKKLSLTHVMDL